MCKEEASSWFPIVFVVNLGNVKTGNICFSTVILLNSCGNIFLPCLMFRLMVIVLTSFLLLGLWVLIVIPLEEECLFQPVVTFFGPSGCLETTFFMVMALVLGILAVSLSGKL